MDMNFPSADQVGAGSRDNYGHTVDYNFFWVIPSYTMGDNWRVSVRLDEDGKIGKPIITTRPNGSGVRTSWAEPPAFLKIPAYVTRKGETLVRNIGIALQKVGAA